MSNLNLKRAIYGGILLLLAAYLGRSLWEERYPPDVRVRMAIQGAIDAFNEGDPSATRIFSRGYRDGDGYDREDVRDAIRWMQAAGGDYRAELIGPELPVEVAPDRAHARVQLAATIWRNGMREDPWWTLEGVLQLELRGRRWRVVSSEEVNHHDRGR